jgi:hypothetical protein
MMRRRFEWCARKHVGLAILLAGQLLCMGQGNAASWQHATSMRLSTEFDTNPALAVVPESGVWRAILDPSYTLTGRIDENDISTGLAIQMARSSNKRLSPDRDSPTAFLNWLRSSEAGDFGITSRYSETATRDSGGVDATGRVPLASTRASRNLSGSWSNQLSERNTLSADGAYEGVTYKGGAYSDYSTRTASLKYNYVLNERATPFMRLTGNRYLPANGGQSSSLVDTTVGLNWKAEFLDWTMQLGKSRGGGEIAGTQGSVSTQYTGQRVQYIVNAGRTVSPSGLGGFVKADHVRANWSYAINENSNAGIDLEHRRNYSTATATAGTSASSVVWMEHVRTAEWRIRSYCQYRTTKGGAVERTSSNLIGLNFAYSNANF